MNKNIIVIPTYNEKNNISILIEKIFNLAPETYVAVVDDNSPDKTAELVEELMKKYARLTIFKRKNKDGLGKAYINAFERILEKKDFDTVTMMDADLSHDPKYLPEMLKLSENFELVIGSSYIPQGGVTKKWGIGRRLLSAAG